MFIKSNHVKFLVLILQNCLNYSSTYLITDIKTNFDDNLMRLSEQQDVTSHFGGVLNRDKRSSSDHANITVTKVEGKIGSQVIINWYGKNNEILMLLATEFSNTNSSSDTHSSLYFSYDHGVTLQPKISTNPENYTTNNSSILRGTVKLGDTSKQNSLRFIMIDLSGYKIYTTKNAGKEFEQIDLSFFVEKISMNPLHEDILLAICIHNDEKNLCISLDFGFTWKTVQTKIKSAYWAATQDNKYEPSKRIYVERDEGYDKISVLRSDDFVEFQKVISNVYSFMVINNMMISRAKSGDGRFELWIAPTVQSAFVRAVFDTSSSFDSFHFVDASDDQILILAEINNTASLYLSEANKVDFNLLLSDIAYIPHTTSSFGSVYEVYKVNGMKSIFIANKFRNGSDLTNKKRNSHISMLNAERISLISFDKGTVWKEIEASSLGTVGHLSKDCNQSDCHLVLNTNSLGVFSSKSAPGFILAEGKYFTDQFPDSRVFFSSDAGRDFKLMASGDYHFSWADHGGVIGFVEKDTIVDTISVSFNQGLNWTNIKFYKHYVYVNLLKSVPGEASTTFYIFATHYSKLLVIQVDVKHLMNGQCNDDQYKDWSLDDKWGGCQLGRRVVYRRRKTLEMCYNGRDFDRPIQEQVCPCRREDYECDVGFYKMSDLSNNTCVKDPEIPQIPLTCVPGSIFKQSVGYRKLLGDQCQGGLETKYLPRNRMCPVQIDASFFIHYNSESQNVLMTDLLTNETTNLFLVNKFKALDFDFQTNCSFYIKHNSNFITKRCFDSPNIDHIEKIVVTSKLPIRDLAFDWLARNLYWVTSDGFLSVSDAEGEVIRVFTSLQYNITSMVLDPQNGVMFLSTFNYSTSVCRIHQVTMDGKSSEEVHRDDCSLHDLTSLTFDYTTHQLYWLQSFYINSLSPDRRHAIIRTTLQPNSITIFKNDILVAISSSIYIIDKYTPNFQSSSLIYSDSGTQFVKAFTRNWQTSSETNPCLYNRCQHLCLLTSSNQFQPNKNLTFSCLCGNSDDMTISYNNEGLEVCSCPPKQVKDQNGFCKARGNVSCSVDEFKCNNGLCVSLNRRCDDKDDCGDNSDEHDCSNCHEKMLLKIPCEGSNQCILPEWVCDGEEDCESGSDEKNCSSQVCPLNHFKCNNNKCIYKSFQCDGEDDCGDQSDEVGCIDVLPGCWPADFICKNSTTQKPVCVSRFRVCDGRRDCLDGSDESEEVCNTTICSVMMKKCDNNNCVFDWFFCDGMDDCGDNSDEKSCESSSTPSPTTPATSKDCQGGYLRCVASGHCFPIEWRCDGVNDCGDSSDEFDCEVSGNFSENGVLNICYDERIQFRCSTGSKCIFRHLICDGDNDCLDWSDERNCTNLNRTTSHECVIGNGFDYTGNRSYTKKGLTCQRWDSEHPFVPRYRPKDAHHNFCRNPDNDPIGPWCYTTNLNYRWDYCAIPKCSGSFIDPNNQNIPSKSHTQECPDGYLECGSVNTKNKCILSRFACDGSDDCGNNADEIYCSSSCHGGFLCTNGRCLSTSVLCNGFDDCGDYSDEHNCSTDSTSCLCRDSHGSCVVDADPCDDQYVCDVGFICPTPSTNDPKPTNFFCEKTNKQISQSQICNFKADCPDQSDESKCYCTSFTSQLYHGTSSSAQQIITTRCPNPPSTSYTVYIYYKALKSSQSITNSSSASLSKFPIHSHHRYILTGLRFATRYCYAFTYHYDDVTLPHFRSSMSEQSWCFVTSEGLPSAPTRVSVTTSRLYKNMVTWQAPEESNGKIEFYLMNITLNKMLPTIRYVYPKADQQHPQESYSLDFIQIFPVTVEVSLAASTSAGVGTYSKVVKKTIRSSSYLDSVQLTSSNVTRTCATLDWHQPITTKYDHFIICLKNNWNLTIKKISRDLFTYRLCHLTPGEAYRVLVVANQAAEDEDPCQSYDYHLFHTQLPAIETPSISSSASYAIDEESVYLSWSSLNDDLNKTKVVFQVCYGISAEKELLCKLVAANNTIINNLYHNKISVFKVRIVEPFYSRWSSSIGLSPKHDHQLSPRNLHVNYLGGKSAEATWQSPYDVFKKDIKYNISLYNNNETEVHLEVSKCYNLTCHYQFNDLHKFTMYNMRISTVIKDIAPGKPATFFFYTSYHIPPITGLHAYRNDENSLKLMFGIPSGFMNFYLRHVDHIQVMLCVNGSCSLETETFPNFHFVLLNHLNYTQKYMVKLIPTCVGISNNTCPKQSHFPFVFGEDESYYSNKSASNNSDLSTTDITAIVISAVVILFVITGIIIYVTRRQQRDTGDYLTMTTSRYDTNSGETFFVSNSQDIVSEILDDDIGRETQIISGFADDEPLIIA